MRLRSACIVPIVITVRFSAALTSHVLWPACWNKGEYITYECATVSTVGYNSCFSGALKRGGESSDGDGLGISAFARRAHHRLKVANLSQSAWQQPSFLANNRRASKWAVEDKC